MGIAVEIPVGFRSRCCGVDCRGSCRGYSPLSVDIAEGPAMRLAVDTAMGLAVGISVSIAVRLALDIVVGLAANVSDKNDPKCRRG